MTEMKCRMSGCQIGKHKVNLTSDLTGCDFIGEGMPDMLGFDKLSHECKKACDEVSMINAFRIDGEDIMDPTDLKVCTSWHTLALFAHKALIYKALLVDCRDSISIDPSMILRMTMNAYSGFHFLVQGTQFDIEGIGYHCLSMMMCAEELLIDVNRKQEFFATTKKSADGKFLFWRESTGDVRDGNFQNTKT